MWQAKQETVAPLELPHYGVVARRGGRPKKLAQTPAIGESIRRPGYARAS